jgi:UDP-glucuronate 4-epimerase
MKVLITGAAGFIGSHLAHAYKLGGVQVQCLDNYSKYYSTDLKKVRVDHFLNRHEIPFHEMDLTSSFDVEKIVTNFEPDVVIHLAAQAGVRLPLSETQKYVDANLVAFTNILKVCVQQEVPQFVYASSSSVYGNSLNVPYKESEMGLSPVSFYGATKLSNELLAQALSFNSRTSTRGLRLFTVYGPWGRPDMAYFRMVANLISGKDFHLFGDGSLKRDFTFIDDAIKSITLLVDQLAKESEGHSDVVNVGGGHEYSMNDLVGIVNNLCNKELHVIQDDPFGGDVKQTLADSSLLKELTGYAPETELLEGIAAVFKWANEPKISTKLTSWIT